MKTVLCISPHFPPVNAADMHRLRQSLPFFEEFGWRPVVFTVCPKHVELSQDPLLLESVPNGTEVHQVEAFSYSWTRKFGLGNLGIRSYFQLRKSVSAYLKHHEVDLVYFTTTVFTVLALGRYWKNRFNVPFVIDLQDPWRNDYYLSLPRENRPRKFWFDYRQKKHLEARTMPHVDGIISVSNGYVHTMKQRYPAVESVPCLTLPFGALESDFTIAEKLESQRQSGTVELVYVGRGGSDMEFALSALFAAVAEGKRRLPKRFSNLRLHFLGTSYAPQGRGEKTVLPLAEQYGLASMVEEQTDRLPYFRAIRKLLDADVLFIPGSNDRDYTASKLYPYILARKPLLAILHENSSAADVLNRCRAGELVSFSEHDTPGDLAEAALARLEKILHRLPYRPDTDWNSFEPYTAREMAGKQCAFFDRVLLPSRDLAADA